MVNTPDEQRHLAEMEMLYGPEHPHSDFRRGEQITFRSADTGLLVTDTIDWVAAAREVRGRRVPPRYIIGLSVVFLSEVIVSGD